MDVLGGKIVGLQNMDVLGGEVEYSRIWTFLEGKLSRLGNTMEEDDSVSFLMEMVIGRL